MKILKMKNPFNESGMYYISYLTLKHKRIKFQNYLIIKGNIKNNGVNTVTQCYIKIKIFDKNKTVISTDKSKVFGDIAPMEARNFHLITAWPNSAKSYNLIFEKVKVK